MNYISPKSLLWMSWTWSQDLCHKVEVTKNYCYRLLCLVNSDSFQNQWMALSSVANIKTLNRLIVKLRKTAANLHIRTFALGFQNICVTNQAVFESSGRVTAAVLQSRSSCLSEKTRWSTRVYLLNRCIFVAACCDYTFITMSLSLCRCGKKLKKKASAQEDLVKQLDQPTNCYSHMMTCFIVLFMFKTPCSYASTRQICSKLMEDLHEKLIFLILLLSKMAIEGMEPVECKGLGRRLLRFANDDDETLGKVSLQNHNLLPLSVHL